VRMIIAVTFCFMLASSEASWANPYIEPKPRRIQSLADVEAAIRDAKAAVGFGQEMSTLWDGRRDLLLEATRGPNEYLARRAMFGLAAIGDADAKAALVGILADSSVSFERRFAAAGALSWTGPVDASCLELLRRFGAEAREHGRIYGDAAILYLARARRPDMQRPLISMGPMFLEFRFLLDDIAEVYVLDNPMAFVSSGVIYSETPSDEKNRHVFKPDEYRHICALLQDGVSYHPQMLTEGSYLVFELKDGRQMAIVRDRSTFWAHESDAGNWASPWFSVRCDSLARYIDRALGR